MDLQIISSLANKAILQFKIKTLKGNKVLLWNLRENKALLSTSKTEGIMKSKRSTLLIILFSKGFRNKRRAANK